MSRSGYDDDYEDNNAVNLWRGAVASAMRGRRGQAFLREMLTALDALPEKRLIAGDLVRDGEVCAIGAVAVARGTMVDDIDPEDTESYITIAARFGIAEAMAREIMYENDEYGEKSWEIAPGPPYPPYCRDPGYYIVTRATPEERFERVRAWVIENLKGETKKDV